MPNDSTIPSSSVSLIFLNLSHVFIFCPHLIGIISYFGVQIQDFLLTKAWLTNYKLLKPIIEGTIMFIVGLIVFRGYFASHIIGLILIFISYFISAYWISPVLVKFYNFIMYMIEKFL